MTWKKTVFKNFKLYAVTDIREGDSEILEKVEAAYRGGADIVQMRSKQLSDAALYRLGGRWRKIADRFRKLFFVNDRLDLALAVKADGIHLGQDDLPMEAVRKIVKSSLLFIGRSTHSFSQALRAAREKPDYIGVGPIFETPTKSTYQPVGIELIKQVKGRVRIPFVCIGGINQTNIHQVIEAGATRVAVVRAIFDSDNVYQATKKLKEIVGAGFPRPVEKCITKGRGDRTPTIGHGDFA